MNFIAEWIIDWLSLRKLQVFSLAGFLRQIRHACATLAQGYMIFNLEQSSFPVYMIPEWNFISEREFHLDWKPEWTHYGMTCIALEWNVILISIMETIQKNVWRWNEPVPEWKSLGYDVPWLAGLVKRMTVSASGEGLSASSFSSSSSPPSASVFWKCESNIIDFLLLHVRLLWKAGLWNSPQFFLPAQSYQVKCSTLKINISV